jgi:hypothetical protein
LTHINTSQQYTSMPLLLFIITHIINIINIIIIFIIIIHYHIILRYIASH